MTYLLQRNEIAPDRRPEWMAGWDWVVEGPYPPAPHVTALWGFQSQEEAADYKKTLESGEWKRLSEDI